MRKLLAVIATTAAVSLPSIASAQQEDARAREYRMWAAEQMIARVSDKLVRSGKACDRAEYLVGQRLSEKCIAAVMAAYPVLGRIREAAASGEPKRWLDTIDAVHRFEREIEEALVTLERK